MQQELAETEKSSYVADRLGIMRAQLEDINARPKTAEEARQDDLREYFT
jgi:hypothetical protein